MFSNFALIRRETNSVLAEVRQSWETPGLDPRSASRLLSLRLLWKVGDATVAVGGCSAASGPINRQDVLRLCNQSKYEHFIIIPTMNRGPGSRLGRNTNAAEHQLLWQRYSKERQRPCCRQLCLHTRDLEGRTGPETHRRRTRSTCRGTHTDRGGERPPRRTRRGGEPWRDPLWHTDTQNVNHTTSGLNVADNAATEITWRINIVSRTQTPSKQQLPSSRLK